MIKKDEIKIPAGEYAYWLNRLIGAQVSGEGVEVPCGDCRGCCTSSYFIHIQPGESQTLSMIPKELKFPAPGLPAGHVLLGYNEKGHCPMFIANKCSIYEHRPQTCRTYDCRIFPATGLSEGKEKPLIIEQANRWQFDFPGKQDSILFAAVKNAALFIQRYKASFPAGFVPPNSTQQAVLAIKVHTVFLAEGHKSNMNNSAGKNEDIVRAVISAYKQF